MIKLYCEACDDHIEEKAKLRAEVSAQSTEIADLKDIITIKDDCIDTLNAHAAKRDTLIRDLVGMLRDFDECSSAEWAGFASLKQRARALLTKVEQSNGR